MSRYLDPTNDVSFKKLFGTEKHKPLLISFLNSILSLTGERQIKAVQLLPKDQAPLLKETKSSILDIKCTDQRNVQYIVEMQNKSVPTFIKRTQFYVAHSYVTQFPSGSTYVELKPVILLAIANHELFPNKDKAISYHKTLDVDTLEHDLEDMSYVFIELPKFSKREEELETIQDKWLYFFSNWNKSNQIPPKIQEKELIEAYHSMEEYNWNEAEREAYIKANIALVDEFEARKKEREEGIQIGIEKGVEIGIEKGVEIGIEKGVEIGIEKGVEIGIEKGVEIGIEKGIEQGMRETAKKMLKEGIPKAVIMRITALPIEELDVL